jgi:hypothetical protein
MAHLVPCYEYEHCEQMVPEYQTCPVSGEPLCEAHGCKCSWCGELVMLDLYAEHRQQCEAQPAPDQHEQWADGLPFREVA